MLNKTTLLLLGCLFSMMVSTLHAGEVQGTIQKLSVGDDNNVYIDITGPYTDPCNGSNPDNFKFAFAVDDPAAELLHSNVLVAYALEKPIKLVGTGGCSSPDSSIELLRTANIIN